MILIKRLFRQRCGFPIYHFRYWFTVPSKTEILKLYERGRYYEVLGLTKSKSLTKQQLQRAYQQVVKLYHPDKVHNQTELKEEYEKITKCINGAYSEIERKMKEAEMPNKKQKDRAEKTKKTGLQSEGTNTANDSTEKQDQINRKAASEYNKNVQSGLFYILRGLAIMALVYVGYIGYSFFFLKNFPQQCPTESKKLPPIYKPTLEQALAEKKRRQQVKRQQEQFIAYMQARVDPNHPPMLRCSCVPQDYKGPMYDLINYTIAQDIHLYQISYKYFTDYQLRKALKDANNINSVEKFELTRMKMNSLISLSLEAERCLQNTLIKASDILEEIEKTGKYTPPKIFFNFRGFIMFEIREKPFSLLNYKGWEYVSLFQLYFDYYSPIYFRHPYFSQFRVYHEPNRHRHFGFVNFNLQELSIQVVKKNQKIVVFHNDFANEEFEVSDWENYYQYYGTSWKQYDLDQYDFQKQFAYLR